MCFAPCYIIIFYFKIPIFSGLVDSGFIDVSRFSSLFEMERNKHDLLPGAEAQIVSPETFKQIESILKCSRVEFKYSQSKKTDVFYDRIVCVRRLLTRFCGLSVAGHDAALINWSAFISQLSSSLPKNLVHWGVLVETLKRKFKLFPGQPPSSTCPM